MPTDRSQQTPSETSQFLFPAEWQAIAAACDDAHNGLIFMQDGIITSVNKVLEELLGLDAAQLVGQPVAALLSGANPDSFLANGNAAGLATPGQTVRLAGKDGSPIEFAVTVNRLDGMTDAAGAAWILHPAAPIDGCGALSREQAQEIVDQLPDPVLICAADSTIRYASPSFFRLCGEPDQLGQSRLQDLAHPEDRARLDDAFGALASRVETPLAFRLRGRDGRWRQCAGQARALAQRGATGAVLVAVHDVTAQTQELQRAAADRKRQLHYLNRLLRLAQQPHPQADTALKVILKAAAKALGAHRCGYWEVGPEPTASRCVMAYDEVRQNLLTGVPEAAETSGAMAAQLAAALHPLLRQVLSDEQALVVADVGQDPRAALACEYFHAASIKALMIVPVRGAEDAAGLLVVSQLHAARAWRKDEAEFAHQCAALIGRVFEEAEHVREKAQQNRHAYQDSLTGLPNRQFLFERAADIFPRMAANSASLAAFFIDLDGLKHVNDALGHAIGDELLKAVALRLKNIVRKDDVLARLGGDEFMLLAQNLSDMRIAEDIAQQIVDAMNAPFSLRGHELQVSVSVGIALYPFDGGDLDTLMKKADIALYHAKSGGRNRYQMFSPRQGGRMSKQSVLEGELRRAIRERELQHYYQPQIDLRTGKVRCVEALLRWHHPRQGLLLPAAFLPLAERSGLIQTISKWVMNDACDQLAAWQDKGLERFSIAINLAAGQLADNNLAAVLEEALDRTGVTPAQLEWEVQENTVMQHDAMSASLLDRMVDMEVALSIDDFGTGYSNLGYLRRYPVRKVKIDRSLIHSLPDEGDGRAITDAIIMMAQPLGLDVVAEGVETPQQMEYLRARGCHIAQGFYFTQPLTADQFETWLIRH
ncbi:EAL domain-containing protein [Noviherbaspirillum sp. UKPF54]|uniref:sensor domain-containing protein n=1 Tax=Noviherbaspirillum sp. UKPF54 TaxID=2601898 RepID=UPI0011B11A46|nr:EAL domain-containing protein [Noviherbaspirillum sp. UKPF54]QDZ26870.1 EAL domain-containing protein [Noviherbaspirillum sp. UKPF54]